MVYVPHLRVSMLGTLPGPEIFSMSLAMDPPSNEELLGAFELEPNNAQWNDIVADCVEWFGRPATAIRPEAVLTRVKIAKINAQGHYAGAPVERAVSQAGGGQGAVEATRKPNQIARAVTLHTNADLGRVKGRFYVPLPSLFVGADGRWTDADVDAAEVSDKELITDLNNEPGIDIIGLRVVVASQGRTRNGVQVLPPGNHPVVAVSVGRTPDTIRRRRNKIPEGRDVLAL